MDRRLLALGLIFVTGFGVAAGTMRLTNDDGPDATASSAPGHADIVLGEGANRFPGSDAADWTKHADYVVSATVTAAEALPPSSEEVERGEGLIFRDLDLSVERVLWSSGDAAVPAPDTFNWMAFGWMFKGSPDTGRIEMGAEGASRLEAGHTYVIALDWVPASCGKPGGVWEGLSNEAIVPFDDAQLGNGEYEGRDITAAEMATEDDGEQSLREEVAGDGAASLSAALDHAEQDSPPMEECD